MASAGDSPGFTLTAPPPEDPLPPTLVPLPLSCCFSTDLGVNKGHDGEMWPKHTVKVKAPLGPPAVRRGWLDEFQEEVILRGAVLLRVEVDVARVGGGRDSAGGGLSLGDALLCVGGRRLGPRCHGPRDGHPVRVVAGLQDIGIFCSSSGEIIIIRQTCNFSFNLQREDMDCVPMKINATSIRSSLHPASFDPDQVCK